MNEKIMSINQIAETTLKSIKFIRREVASGELKSFKKGNRIFVYEKDFLFWKEALEDRFCEYTKSLDTKTSNRINKIKKEDDVVNWVDVENEMQLIDGWKYNEQIRKFNFIDLFTGAGGLSCGLIMAGMMPVGSAEIMPQAVDTYKYNFARIKDFDEVVKVQDIRENETKNELINIAENKHIHLIAGGFPCQGFSMAGNRILADPRNSLYLDMLEKN